MDPTEILKELGLSFRLPGEHEHTHTGWVNFDCPWCEDRDEFHMGWKNGSNYLNCWQCGGHGLIVTLARASGRPYDRVEDLLEGLDTFKEEKPPKAILEPPKGIGLLLPGHRHYLQKRGFNSDKLVKLWKIGGIGNAVFLPWHIAIPVIHRGVTVAWTFRSIDDSGRRYFSNGPVKDYLYGEDYAKHTIIICEGPFDVWRIGPGAVATMGTSTTREQIHRISHFPIRVVCYDSEKRAQDTADLLCQSLSAFPGSTTRISLDAKDPGEATDKEIALLQRTFLK